MRKCAGGGKCPLSFEKTLNFAALNLHSTEIEYNKMDKHWALNRVNVTLATYFIDNSTLQTLTHLRPSILAWHCAVKCERDEYSIRHCFLVFNKCHIEIPISICKTNYHYNFRYNLTLHWCWSNRYDVARISLFEQTGFISHQWTQEFRFFFFEIFPLG